MQRSRLVFQLLSPSLTRIGVNHRLLSPFPRGFSTLSSSRPLLLQRTAPLYAVRWSSSLGENSDSDELTTLNKKIIHCFALGDKKETRNPLERASGYLGELSEFEPNSQTIRALLGCGRAAINWPNTTLQNWKEMKNALEQVSQSERDQKWLQSMILASVGMGELEEAFKYYNALKELCEVVPKGVLGDLLRGCADKGDLERATACYEILKEHHSPGKQAMESLLKTAFASSDWEKMEFFFDEMTKSFGLQPNHSVLGLMIDGCLITGASGNPLEKALKYVTVLSDQQMLPNLRIHQALHKCALVSNNIDAKLWGELNNLWADTVELACIATGASFEPKKALEVFTRLREEGQRLPPNVLNSLMSNFANFGDSKVVDALYEEFLELGYKPIRFTLQSLVRAGRKGQDWLMMEDRYNEITQNFQVKPTFATLNSMIEGCALRGPSGMDSPVATAEKFLKEIQAIGKKPNLATYHALTRCAKKGTTLSAMEDQWILNRVFKEVKESGSYQFGKGEGGEGEEVEGGEEVERKEKEKRGKGRGRGGNGRGGNGRGGNGRGEKGRGGRGRGDGKGEGEERKKVYPRESRPLIADD